MADEATKDGRTITVEIDGEAREVKLPDGYLAPDDVREHYMPREMFRSELSKQVREKTKGLVQPDDLLNDDGFLERLAEERKDELIERLGISQTAEPDEAVVAKLQRRIEDQKVKPLQEQLEESKKLIGSLRSRERDADVERSMSQLGVDDEMRELVALWGRERQQYDEEHGWVVVDEDGDIDWVQGENGKPEPKRFSHLLQEIKRSNKKPSWFRGEVRSGAGYRGSEKAAAGSKKRSEMSREEKIAYIREHGDAAYLQLPQ